MWLLYEIAILSFCQPKSANIERTCFYLVHSCIDPFSPVVFQMEFLFCRLLKKLFPQKYLVVSKMMKMMIKHYHLVSCIYIYNHSTKYIIIWTVTNTGIINKTSRYYKLIIKKLAEYYKHATTQFDCKMDHTNSRKCLVSLQRRQWTPWIEWQRLVLSTSPRQNTSYN